MKIKKGDTFRCIKDIIMEGDREVAYVKDKVYTSEQNGCITDEQGCSNHSWYGLDKDVNECFEFIDNYKPQSILNEAEYILNGSRQADYGDAVENFRHIAQVANLMGVKVTASDCCKVLIALKICREGNKHKRDNLVDLAAYADILNQIYESYESI